MSESCKVAGIASAGRGPQRHSGPRFPEQPRLQDHLSQLLHKERDPIRLGDDLLDHLGRQRLPPATRSTITSIWGRVQTAQA